MDAGKQFHDIVGHLELEGVGQDVVREIPHPKTMHDIYHHLVNDHGHDDLDDHRMRAKCPDGSCGAGGPGMPAWRKSDYEEQHAEAHEGEWGEGADHVHR